MEGKPCWRIAVPRGIYVPLPPQAREALFDWTDNEWRSPREQAAKFVVEGLRSAGALPTEQTASHCAEAATVAVAK